MKKIILIGILLLLGWLGWYFLSPLFIDNVVNESLPVSETASSSYKIIASGSFTGFDRLHNGSGTAELIETDGKYIVRFEEDFNVTNGPDLYVGFGKDGNYVKGSEIAPLKGNIGSQNYVVPSGMNLENYNEVWIWCNRFSVPFAKASLSQIE